MAKDWNTMPVIEMKFVDATKDCPVQWEQPPFFNENSETINAKPLQSKQPKLCLKRAGLPADETGKEPRPRSACFAKDNLKTCMTGQYPYCGQLGVNCPLVDVADVTKGHNNVFSMRHSCLSSIPDAYLPWTGCRPIVSVVVAGSRPCFKYNMMGWSGKQPDDIKGLVENKKCVIPDTRFRFLKEYPFRGSDGVVRESPDAGIYYRNELFFNPLCPEPQNKFEEGYQKVQNLQAWAVWMVGACAIAALYVGLMYSMFSEKMKPQTIAILNPFQPRDIYDRMQMVTIFMRASILLIAAQCAFASLFLKMEFAPLALDQTCTDPLVQIVLAEFIEVTKWITMFMFLCLIVSSIQLGFDLTIEPCIRQEEVPEEAPLFRPLPEESEEDIALRERTKYVYVPSTEDLPKDMETSGPSSSQASPPSCRTPSWRASPV